MTMEPLSSADPEACLPEDVDRAPSSGACGCPRSRSCARVHPRTPSRHLAPGRDVGALLEWTIPPLSRHDRGDIRRNDRRNPRARRRATTVTAGRDSSRRATQGDQGFRRHLRVGMLERVIEEQTGRSAGRAVRASLVALIGDISRTRPGSKEAARVKEALVAQGAWSQY